MCLFRNLFDSVINFYCFSYSVSVYLFVLSPSSPRWNFSYTTAHRTQIGCFNFWLERKIFCSVTSKREKSEGKSETIAPLKRNETNWTLWKSRKTQESQSQLWTSVEILSQLSQFPVNRVRFSSMLTISTEQDFLLNFIVVTICHRSLRKWEQEEGEEKNRKLRRGKWGIWDKWTKERRTRNKRSLINWKLEVHFLFIAPTKWCIA